MDCDVLVVGAGPAGAAAARACSMRGLRTILIDKRKEIGVPVRCGEGIGSYLLRYLPFRIPNEYLEWKMHGMSFYTDNLLLERFGNFWEGYSVDRLKFDKWLVNEAVRQGTKLLINHELVGLRIDETCNSEAYFRSPSGEIQVQAKYLIAADGVDSKVSKILKTAKSGGDETAEVYSWEVSNIKLYNSFVEQIFLGDYIPRGYAFIFPKSKNSANIGIGGLYTKGKLKSCFDEFLESKFVRSQVKNCKFVVEKSGRAPVKGNSTLGYKNIFFCGDSANQNLKPFIEGILPGIICGDAAGNTVDKGIRIYKEKLDFIFGDFLRESEKYNNALFKVWDLCGEEKYIILALIISGNFRIEELDKLTHLDFKSLMNLADSKKNKKWSWKEFGRYKYLEVMGSLKRIVF